MAKKHMHIKVEDTLLSNFDATCQQHGLDRSEVIRNLMFDFINKYKEVEKMRNWKEIYKAKEKDEAGYVLVTSDEMDVNDLEDEIWDEIETQGCKCAVGEYDEENNLKSLLFTVWE